MVREEDEEREEGLLVRGGGENGSRACRRDEEEEAESLISAALQDLESRASEERQHLHTQYKLQLGKREATGERTTHTLDQRVMGSNAGHKLKTDNCYFLLIINNNNYYYINVLIYLMCEMRFHLFIDSSFAFKFKVQRM